MHEPKYEIDAEEKAKLVLLHRRMNFMYQELGLDMPAFAGSVLGYLQGMHRETGPDAMLGLIGTLEMALNAAKKDAHH